MLNINNKTISRVFVGSTEIGTGYSGSQLVFQKKPPTLCIPYDFFWDYQSEGFPNGLILTETGSNSRTWTSNPTPQANEIVLTLTEDSSYFYLRSSKYQGELGYDHIYQARGQKNGATEPWDSSVTWYDGVGTYGTEFNRQSSGYILPAKQFLYVKKWDAPVDGDTITIFNGEQGEIIATVQYDGENEEFVAEADMVSSYISISESSDGFRFECRSDENTIAEFFNYGCNVVFSNASVQDIDMDYITIARVNNRLTSDIGTGTDLNRLFSIGSEQRGWFIWPINYPNTVYVYGSNADSHNVTGTYTVVQQNNADMKFRNRPVYYSSTSGLYLLFAGSMYDETTQTYGDFAWMFYNSVTDLDIHVPHVASAYAYEPYPSAFVTNISTWKDMYSDDLENFTVSRTPLIVPIPSYPTPVYVYGTAADSYSLSGTYEAVMENGSPVTFNNRVVYYCSSTNKYLLYAEGMEDDYAWVFRSSISNYGIDFFMGNGDVFGYEISGNTTVVGVSTWQTSEGSLSNFTVSTTEPSITPSQGTITFPNGSTVQVSGTVGTAITSINLASYVSVSNGNTPSFSASSLPSGLSLSQAGVLSGTPNATDSSNYSVTVSATGCTSATMTLSASISAASTPVVSGDITVSGTVAGENGYSATDYTATGSTCNSAQVYYSSTTGKYLFLQGYGADLYWRFSTTAPSGDEWMPDDMEPSMMLGICAYASSSSVGPANLTYIQMGSDLNSEAFNVTGSSSGGGSGGVVQGPASLTVTSTDYSSYAGSYTRSESLTANGHSVYRKGESNIYLWLVESGMDPGYYSWVFGTVNNTSNFPEQAGGDIPMFYDAYSPITSSPASSPVGLSYTSEMLMAVTDIVVAESSSGGGTITGPQYITVTSTDCSSYAGDYTRSDNLTVNNHSVYKQNNGNTYIWLISDPNVSNGYAWVFGTYNNTPSNLPNEAAGDIFMEYPSAYSSTTTSPGSSPIGVSFNSEVLTAVTDIVITETSSGGGSGSSGSYITISGSAASNAGVVASDYSDTGSTSNGLPVYYSSTAGKYLFVCYVDEGPYSAYNWVISSNAPSGNVSMMPPPGPTDVYTAVSSDIDMTASYKGPAGRTWIVDWNQVSGSSFEVTDPNSSNSGGNGGEESGSSSTITITSGPNWIQGTYTLNSQSGEYVAQDGDRIYHSGNYWYIAGDSDPEPSFQLYDSSNNVSAIIGTNSWEEVYDLGNYQSITITSSGSSGGSSSSGSLTVLYESNASSPYSGTYNYDSTNDEYVNTSNSNYKIKYLSNGYWSFRNEYSDMYGEWYQLYDGNNDVSSIVGTHTWEFNMNPMDSASITITSGGNSGGGGNGGGSSASGPSTVYVTGSYVSGSMYEGTYTDRGSDVNGFKSYSNGSAYMFVVNAPYENGYAWVISSSQPSANASASDWLDMSGYAYYSSHNSDPGDVPTSPANAIWWNMGVEYQSSEFNVSETSSGGGGNQEPEPDPGIGPEPVVLPVYSGDPIYDVSDNFITEGEYYLASSYNVWADNGSGTPTETNGNFNGRPVYYCPNTDLYLFRYSCNSGNYWALSAYVREYDDEPGAMGFTDYCTTEEQSILDGTWQNGSTIAEHDPCLVAGTKISLADGSTKNVEDITYDDELLVWNFDEGKLDKAKPLWIMKKRETHNWQYNMFSNGSVLKTVGSKGGGHRLFNINQNNFDYPVNSVGYNIATENGTTTILTRTMSVSGKVDYYNIITDKHMNLYANGILTSTHLNNLYPIFNMKFVKQQNVANTNLEGIPQEYIDGLRLTEQPSDERKYVLRLLKLAKEK